jgi:hypothetical protein
MAETEAGVRSAESALVGALKLDDSRTSKEKTAKKP